LIHEATVLELSGVGHTLDNSGIKGPSDPGKAQYYVYYGDKKSRTQGAAYKKDAEISKWLYGESRRNRWGIGSFLG